MKILRFALFILVLVSFSAYAGTAYFSHSEVSGMNRICYYTGAGGTYAITIKATRVCPATIEV